MQSDDDENYDVYDAASQICCHTAQSNTVEVGNASDVNPTERRRLVDACFDDEGDLFCEATVGDVLEQREGVSYATTLASCATASRVAHG